jgi:hypothetical protein
MDDANVKVRPNVVAVEGLHGDVRDHLHGAVRHASERHLHSTAESEWLTRNQLIEWQLTKRCSSCGSSSYYCGCEQSPSWKSSR